MKFFLPIMAVFFTHFASLYALSSAKENWEAKDVVAFDRFSVNFTASSTPSEPFTLQEAKLFIELYYALLLFDESSLLEENKAKQEALYKNVLDYYTSIHHAEDFTALEIEVMRDLAFLHISDLNMLDNKNFRLLCHKVLTHIDGKVSKGFSVSGHPRELLSYEDFSFLKQLIQSKDRGFQNSARKAKSDLDVKLKTADQALKCYEGLFSRLTALQASEGYKSFDAELYAEGKKALLEIELSIGRQFIIKDLIENEELSQANAKGLSLLLLLDTFRGKHIDDSILKALKLQHAKAFEHPKVVIEGGGPTGLLLAITQYEAGADVVLFEKRSMLYERTQIVRLDPKWMCLLKYYLGEGYYSLFFDSGHKGICRFDGFGEIATKDLEDALHIRLTELISIQDEEGSIERLGAHELKDVIRPNEFGEPFKVVADYLPQYDRGITSKQLEQEVRPVDLLICAGGKSSSMLKIFLPSSTLVNRPQYYGVCSWLSKNFKAQNPEEMNFFKDFRGIVHMDSYLLEEFKARLKERFTSFLEADIADELFNKGFLPLDDWLERPFLQTRTFENKGLIYIGMELPPAFKDLILEVSHAPLLDKMQAQELVKQVQQAWFELIASYYELEDSLQMDTNFVASFPVEQGRLAKDHLYSETFANGKRLLVTAAGDAFATPHFMRYSGLTGARENILHLQAYMQGRAEKNLTEDELLRSFVAHSEATADFVINRGLGFLSPRKEESIAENRTFNMLKALQSAASHWEDKSSYLVPIVGNTYLLRYREVNYIIEAKEGYLIVNGGAIENQTFTSIKQLLFTLL